jgi:hypothetical protein
MNIRAVLEQQPYNVRISAAVLGAGSQMQRSDVVGISGVRIYAMLEKDPSSSHVPKFRSLMQRSPTVDVQSICICAVLEEKPSDLFSLRKI